MNKLILVGIVSQGVGLGCFVARGGAGSVAIFALGSLVLLALAYLDRKRLDDVARLEAQIAELGQQMSGISLQLARF